MSITLPPYPWGTFADDSIEFKVTQGQLRARDIEVARLVLEAAADFMKMEGFGGYAIAIRALEFRHHE